MVELGRSDESATPRSFNLMLVLKMGYRSMPCHALPQSSEDLISARPKSSVCLLTFVERADCYYAHFLNSHCRDALPRVQYLSAGRMETPIG